MVELTGILARIEAGDPVAADQLLPLVYEELRALATAKLAHEQPGQTLQPTALVHEAYLRLNKGESTLSWQNRRHFFGAAAEAMRRILIEKARRRQAVRHGGGRQRVDGNALEATVDAAVQSTSPLDLLELDDVLSRLEAESPQHAQLVKLRFFVGLTMSEIAHVQGISLATVERQWVYARTWLYAALQDGEEHELPANGVSTEGKNLRKS